MRLRMNDRYIVGTVAFESDGKNGTLSYLGIPNVPLGTEYTIEGVKWRVVQVRKSKFNPQIVNVDMVITEEN